MESEEPYCQFPECGKSMSVRDYAKRHYCSLACEVEHEAMERIEAGGGVLAMARALREKRQYLCKEDTPKPVELVAVAGGSRRRGPLSDD